MPELLEHPKTEDLEATLLKERLGSTMLLEEAQSGDSISKSDLNKIRKWTAVDIPAERLVVFPVLAIDDRPTRNSVIYTAESQKKSVKSWVGTTFLFNRNGTQGIWDGGPDHKVQAASQSARIFKSAVVKTPWGSTGTLVHIFAVREVDEEIDSFIRRVEAGILREVSIHVQVQPGSLQCSICKDSFDKCEEPHYPGSVYGKQTCYISTGEGLLTPIELSAVACPGSLVAHIMAADETEKYTLLKESLGGSAEVFTLITDLREGTPVNAVAEARQKLFEAIKKSGLTFSAFTENADNKALLEAAGIADIKAIPSEITEAATAFGITFAEAKTKKEDPKDGDGDDDKTGKQSASSRAGALFEGFCPACLRDGKTESVDETEALKKLREQTQEQVSNIVAETTKKVNEFKPLAEERNAIFSDIVSETASLAVERGVKTDEQREAYTKELSALSYPALKVVRETLLATKDQREVTRESLQTKHRIAGGAQTEKSVATPPVRRNRRPTLASNTITKNR